MTMPSVGGKSPSIDDVCTHGPLIIRPLDAACRFVPGACAHCDNLMIEDEDVSRFLQAAKMPLWRSRLEEKLTARWTAHGACLATRVPLSLLRDGLCHYVGASVFTKAMMEWLRKSMHGWEMKGVAFVEIEGPRSASGMATTNECN